MGYTQVSSFEKTLDGIASFGTDMHSAQYVAKYHKKYSNLTSYTKTDKRKQKSGATKNLIPG